MKITLDCTLDQFTEIHRQVDRTRTTSTTVKVDKAALEALLRDHGKLLARYKVEG